jgi:hypothetical protein
MSLGLNLTRGSLHYKSHRFKELPQPEHYAMGNDFVDQNLTTEVDVILEVGLIMDILGQR